MYWVNLHTHYIHNTLQFVTLIITVNYHHGHWYFTARRFSRRAAEFDICSGICCLPRKNVELPIFATLIPNSRFFFNLTIYKTIKSSHCKLWFCALAPSSKVDTRQSACSLCCVFNNSDLYLHYNDIFIINGQK